MAPAILQRACVACLLALTSPPSFSNNLLKRSPTATATTTSTTATTWPYSTSTASAFISAAPPTRRGIDGTVRDLSRRCTSSPSRSRRPTSRRHATPTTTTPPSFSGRRRSRLQGGAAVVVGAGAPSAAAAAAGTGGPLTRLSVAATLVDRRERRVVGTPSRPLPPPPGAAAASVVGSTGPRDLSEAPVEVIDSMDTYFRVMEENANDIVVVKVYAGFCRACKAFDRKYRVLALDYEEAGANIKFFEMDWMQTRDLCKSLQVKKLPHLELYAGERGRLESFVCGPSKAGVLKEKLDALLADPSDPSLGTAPTPLSPAPLSPS